MPSVEYRRMVAAEDLDMVYRLRYDGYTKHGKIPHNETRRSSDRFDELPNTQIFGVFIGGKLASSFRFTLLSQATPDSPSMVTYTQELTPYIKRGLLMVDPSRFVIDERAAAQFPELPYVTMRIPIMACLHFDADHCISTVQKHHQAFYRRLFRAEKVGPPVHYELLNMDVQLMVSDVDAIHDELDTRYPFFRSHYLERRQLFGPAHAMPGVAKASSKAA